MTQDNPRMGDLNELVERLNSAASIIEQWDAWELGAANKPTVRLSVSPSKSIREAAAALTSLIAERDAYAQSCKDLGWIVRHNITRAEAAEAQLKAARGHIEQLSELLKIIKEAWVDYDHVYSISVHEADEFLAALSLDTNKGDGA